MLQVPTEKELQEVAEQLGFVLDDKELPSLQKLMQPAMAAYNTIAKLPGNLSPFSFFFFLLLFVLLLLKSRLCFFVFFYWQDFLPEVKYPRTPGYRPDLSENKYNAWYYKTKVVGNKEGKLAGRTVALKVPQLLMHHTTTRHSIPHYTTPYILYNS